MLKFRLSLHHDHQCNYCYKFKNKFLELEHLLLSNNLLIKADEGKSYYLATFSTKDLNSNLIKHNQNKDIMGTTKSNCCVVARSFKTFLNSSHLNVSRFECFANFMVLEIDLNFNCFLGMVEFKVSSGENLVQEHLWKYQRRFFLVLPKIILFYHPASV